MNDKGQTVWVVDEGAVRALIVENPPVNALGAEVRVALIAALDEAAADDGVGAVVLASAGDNFIVGADIGELDAPINPRVFDLVGHVEAMHKPTVAALKGFALGGGFELALACDRRIAQSSTRVGFPEVKLGLLPGAGGTQVTPRLAGPVAALDLIAMGKPVPASKAQELGLIDAVVSGEVLPAAITEARALIDGSEVCKRARDRAVPDDDAEAYQRLTERLGWGPLEAPKAIVEAIDAARALPFPEGLARERDLFETLRTGEQSRALRYQFFAERKAARVAGISRDTPVQPVTTIGIVGGGTMGRGIALAALAAGYTVRLVDADANGAAGAREAIAAGFERDVSKGRLSSEGRDERLDRTTVIEGPVDALGAVDLVIEAAFEDIAVKKDIFSALDRAMPASTILATNTSSLDVNAIAAATSRPEAVLGLHFFSPANIMRLLEVVRADATSATTLASALAVAKRLRKAAVVVGVCDGFVGNRMLAQRHIAAERLLIEGALPEEVDRAWVAFGFPMGVFAMTDLAGVDVNWRVRNARGTALAIHDALYEMGRYGQKTGAGFFRYAEGDRTPRPDPEVEALIVSHSAGAGVTRRGFDDTEILERLLFPMINEGAHLLEEGVAQRASDIDVVWVNGYGWPGWRGGPMYYADRLGLSHVVERLSQLHLQFGNTQLAPAPLLVRLAEAGEMFTG